MRVRIWADHSGNAGTVFHLQLLDGYRAGEFVRDGDSERPLADTSAVRLTAWARETGYEVIPGYIPAGEYDIGLCHYGKTEPYKTVTVKADSRQQAMAEGRKLLSPSTVERVCHVATRPNPDYVATNGLPLWVEIARYEKEKNMLVGMNVTDKVDGLGEGEVIHIYENCKLLVDFGGGQLLDRLPEEVSFAKLKQDNKPKGASRPKM